MASVQELTTAMAAAYYAAALRRDPTLDENPDPEQMDTYLATGARLLVTFMEPSSRFVVRCYRSGQDDAHTTALATVHDHRLVVFEKRGTAKWHSRLNRYSVVDLDLARDEGHRSIVTWCPTCGQGHNLKLRWLKRTPVPDRSDRTFEVKGTWAPDIPDYLEPDDLDGLYRYEGDLPLVDNWYRNVAFARIVGTLDFPLLIMSEWFRPLHYIETFGVTPATIDHVRRLYGDNHIVSQRDLFEDVERFAHNPDFSELAHILRGAVNRP